MNIILRKIGGHASVTMALPFVGSVKLRELRQKRGTIVEELRGLTDKAEKEKRNLDAEEEKRYDALFADADSLGKAIAREERLADLERETAETRSRENPEPKPGDEDRDGGAMKIAELRKILPGYNLGEGDDADLEERFGELLVERSAPAARRQLRSFLATTFGVRSKPRRGEKRALQADIDTSGGYTVAPLQFVAQLLKNIDDLVFIRARATKFLVPTASGMGVPTLENDPADADWTSELATGGEDSTMSFGTRELRPHPLAKRIKISNKLLRSSLLDMEGLVRQRLGYKFAITEEKGFLTGTGVQQPLGLFTASADGIPTTRDVSTGNTTTSMTFDGLTEAKYSLKAPYWKSAAWMFHRDGVKQIAKLKDGNGQYIWQPSKVVGEPDTLLSFPVQADEYIPNTFTTGQYVGILGDYSYYWIVDALDFVLQRLSELYAETNQTGLIGRAELDGQPVLAEAFARVKLG
jgi:HK97 family phage major capsid protein